MKQVVRNGRHEILCRLLLKARKPSKKTRLCYAMNQDGIRNQLYFKVALENELIQHMYVKPSSKLDRGQSGDLYMITVKGLNYLKLFGELNQLINWSYGFVIGDKNAQPLLKTD